MKKWIAVLFVCLMLTACSAPLSQNGELEGVLPESSKAQNGRVLPEKLQFELDGQTTEIPFNWGENICDFVVNGETYRFVYDPEKRSLAFTYTANGEEICSEEFLVFDEAGRILSMTLNGRTVITLSYEGEKMFANDVAERDENEPIEVDVDRAARKMAMPPFEDPDDYVIYTEYGDLTEGEGQHIYTYTYDEYGNIREIQHDLNGAVTTFTDSDRVMTESWQRIPAKVAHIFCGANASWAMLALDMMCASLI